MRLRLTVICVLMLPWAVATAAAAASPRVNIAVPLVDLPFNSQTDWRYPSMGQTLGVTRAFLDTAHWTMEAKLGLDPYRDDLGGIGVRLAYFLTDALLLMPLPLGDAWLHEEWHRAVMAHRGVASYNDVYKLDLGASAINVSHETDEDLTRLKRDHNEDQVRLAAAGMEAERTLLLASERDTFFRGGSTYRTAQYLTINASIIGYVTTCDSGEADRETDDANKEEGAVVSRRDFTGLDCTGWIRDLSRPDEPYAARGTHPSGVGINRYTRYQDLTSSERHYLRLSRNLAFLSLVDPFLVGKEAFHGHALLGEGEARYNASLSHYLTSFGNDVGLNLLYASSATKLALTVHGYGNHHLWLPGVEAQLLDVPLPGLAAWDVSLKGMLWQQPRGLAFDTTRRAGGGLAGVTVTYRRYAYQPYLTISGKTEGWVAGEVEQGRELRTVLGVATSFGGGAPVSEAPRSL